jgi:hypothetical protein
MRRVASLGMYRFAVTSGTKYRAGFRRCDLAEANLTHSSFFFFFLFFFDDVAPAQTL